MLDTVMDSLACPHCGEGISRSHNTARCANGHAFDIARQGYISLLPAGTHTGTADTAAMVDARVRFLAAGHYENIADAVARVAESSRAASLQAVGSPGVIADIGSGPGYYLARACERTGLPGIALDISKYAARRAAKAHPRIGAVVADAWGRLPVRDSVAALILDIFSPRNPIEFHRILRPGGTAIVVVPDACHLGELVEPLGLLTVDADKLEALDARMDPHFKRIATLPVAYRMALSHEEVSTVVAMGPSSWHADPERLRHAIDGLPELTEVTASVHVAAYQRP